MVSAIRVLVRSLLLPIQIPRLWRSIVQTHETAAPITLSGYYVQKVLGVNGDAYWPMHFSSKVVEASRIRVGVGTAPGLSHGCYIQGTNGIELGDYTIVAPGVGIISANHDIYDCSMHERERPIRIGRYCWLGMNSVILPGVCLGDHTVVAAGAVVTRSFPDGYCVVGGVPARVLKTLSRDRIIEHRNDHEYLGYWRMKDASKELIFQRLGIEEI
jgi:acetyltransferase-like isoleucine patch superfamily enzyme